MVAVRFLSVEYSSLLSRNLGSFKTVLWLSYPSQPHFLLIVFILFLLRMMLQKMEENRHASVLHHLF